MSDPTTFNIETSEGTVQVSDDEDKDESDQLSDDARVVNNSPDDVDLIAGDDIGGDNSKESSQQASEQFARDVAGGKEAVAAGDGPVNSVKTKDGGARAVAASKEEIREAGVQLAEAEDPNKEPADQEKNKSRADDPEKENQNQESQTTDRTNLRPPSITDINLGNKGGAGPAPTTDSGSSGQSGGILSTLAGPIGTAGAAALAVVVLAVAAIGGGD